MYKNAIAAIAALGVSVTAFADISITGAYEGEFSNGGSGAYEYTQDMDLTIKGKSGDTTVTATLEDLGKDANNTAVSTNQVYINTKLGDLDIEAGKKKGMNGNGLLQKKSSASQKFSAKTTVGPASVKVGQKSGDANATVDTAFDLAGVSVKVQNATNDARFVTVGAEYNGFAINAETQEASAGNTNTAYSIGADVSGIAVTYVNVDVQDAAGVTQDDGILGDISDATAGKDLYGVVGSLDVATLGKVTGKYISKNDKGIYVGKLERGIWSVTATDVQDADTTYSAKMTVTF